MQVADEAALKLQVAGEAARKPQFVGEAARKPQFVGEAARKPQFVGTAPWCTANGWQVLLEFRSWIEENLPTVGVCPAGRGCQLPRSSLQLVAAALIAAVLRQIRALVIIRAVRRPSHRCS
ncbi:MAG: hypothetical protein L0G69_08200 [Brevibacterium sp.]|nr:hypothetical protein [Brevibacterium sp.]